MLDRRQTVTLEVLDQQARRAAHEVEKRSLSVDIGNGVRDGGR